MRLQNAYRVAVHYNEVLGYVEYREDERAATVVLDDVSKKAETEVYLAQARQIRVPKESLLEFETRTIQPLRSLEEFKLAMTRIWGEIGLHVDWSRPVEAL